MSYYFKWMREMDTEFLKSESEYLETKLEELKKEILRRGAPLPHRRELALVLGGKKIEAIKLYRDRWAAFRFGEVASLGECKEALDSWLEKYGLTEAAAIFNDACAKHKITD